MVPLSRCRHVLSLRLTSFQFVQISLKIIGIRRCTFGLERGAKHSPPSRNAGRPSGQKSTLSDLVGFLIFIQLGSQLYNGAIESVQTCTIIKAYKLSVCANIIENHRHARVHVWIRTWCEALSSISECWAALRAEIDTFRSDGISDIHSSWESSFEFHFLKD